MINRSVPHLTMTSLLYSDLPQADRYTGSVKSGEIEIVIPPSGAVPIVFENKYLTLVNDPVRFPNGKDGHYLRALHPVEVQGRHGTVMVTRKGNQYVLLRLFRHPTRSWELEFPRGFAEPDLSAEENARKEVREELGVEVTAIEEIGVICPNTGLLATRAHVFLVELESLPQADGEEQAAEAIESFRWVNQTDLMKLIRSGEIRCAFTLGALMLVLCREFLAAGE